jgi:uncharacterized membrane protein HdeD (DUF308 family)
MDVVGAVTLVTSGALVVAVAVAWSRIPPRVGDVFLAAGGVGMAVGGLLLMDDPAASAWAIAPPVVAILTVLHVRLLVAPGGPLRT